jgi:hypothetical protein
MLQLASASGRLLRHSVPSRINGLARNELADRWVMSSTSCIFPVSGVTARHVDQAKASVSVAKDRVSSPSFQRFSLANPLADIDSGLLPSGSIHSPSLLGGLAADAEPGADLGPGVAAGTQAFDGFGYGGVDLLGQAEHEG